MAERNPEENRKEKRKRGEELILFLSAHHVSLTLPVDPGPAHMSAHQLRICFYYYMIGCGEKI